jgi:serine O-acetyltransferase
MQLKNMIPSKLQLFKYKKNKTNESSCNQKGAGRATKQNTSTIMEQMNSKNDAISLFIALRKKAIELTKSEQFMTPLLNKTILHPKTTNFNSAISRIIASRLMSSCGKNSFMHDDILYKIIEDSMNSTDLEYGHTMSDAVVKDILACKRRDPACETELEVVLFFKGFASLVCHRAARRHYSRCSNSSTRNGDTSSNDQRFVSLWLQSQASAAFGVDIHPAAEIGAGVFFDHATGLVIGETAKVGDNCTILHGVTLGGTGKNAGDRHPKIGNDVLIGAGTSILGNIKIGNGAKIGAGSIVLNPIPNGATAVGTPAKVIGWAKENTLKKVVDMYISNVASLDENDENLSVTNSSITTAEITDYSSHSIITLRGKEAQFNEE